MDGKNTLQILNAPETKKLFKFFKNLLERNDKS